jgi:hypothetical protein
VDVVTQRVDLLMSLLTIGVVLIAWDIVLRAWGKVGFKGSAEWVMGVIVRKALRVRSKDRPWHDLPKLSFISRGSQPDWIDHHPSKPPVGYDSRLSFILSLFGFIFFPLSIISLRLSKYAVQKEGRNFYNRAARAFSWAGIIFTASWAIAFSQIRGIVLK